MKTVTTLLSYTLVFLSISGSVQARRYHGRDVYENRLIQRALYELEARDELDGFLAQLETRGLFSKGATSKAGGSSGSTKVATPPRVSTKNSAQPQIQAPPRTLTHSTAQLAAQHIPEPVHASQQSSSGSAKPKVDNFATPGRPLGGGAIPAADTRHEQISKAGLAAMKRQDEAKSHAKPADAASHTTTESNRRKPMTKEETAQLSQRLESKKLEGIRAGMREGHDNLIKQDSTAKPRGAFGRLKDYATKVRNPSVVPEKESKTHIDAAGNIHHADKTKKPDEAAFKSDGITVAGQKEGKWYHKAANAVVHPLHYMNDKKTQAQQKKLDFDKKFESADKVKFQTEQNEFEAGEANRRKDHRVKQTGDTTGVNHALRYTAAASQAATIAKTAGLVRRRSLEDLDFDMEDFQYRRVRRFIEAFEAEFDMDFE